MGAPATDTRGDEVRTEGSPLAVGVVLGLASDLMIFAGFFAAYFTLRASADEWPPGYADLDVAGPAIFTAVLVAAALAATRARVAAVAGETAETRAWLYATALLGAVFAAGTALELADLGFGIDTDAYGSIFWITVGMHWLHVVAGIGLVGIVLAVTGARSRMPLDTTVAALAYVWWFLVGLSVAVLVVFYVIR